MGAVTSNYNNQSSAGAAGSIAYAIQPFAMAKGINQLKSNLIVTSKIRNVSQDAKVQGAGYADSVRFPKWGSLSANTKTVGTEATRQQATMTKVDLQLDTFKTVDFLLEDFGGLFTPSAKEGFAIEAGGALAEAVETDVIALYASAAHTVGDVSTAASVALISSLKKEARTNKWRNTSPFIAVWGTQGEYDLMNDATLKQYIVTGGDQTAIREGSIGNIYGFANYVSNLMPTVAGSPSAEHGLAFQPEAMGIAFVDMTSEVLPGVQVTPMNWSDDEGNLIYSMRSIVGYNQLARGLEVSFDTIYGVKVIEDALLIDVLYGAY